VPPERAKQSSGGIGGNVARLTLRDSVQIGVLMNTRGLIELIVLYISLTAGVLDTRLFSEMIARAP
jgi:Kef-type K+ transport system membrane component KefB